MSKRTYCEFQGEDHPLMFRAQRNHIRINSDQRHHFRGKKAVLLIEEAEVQLYGTFPDGGTFTSYPSMSTLGFIFEGDVNGWLISHMAQTGEKLRVMYRYKLIVEDPDLEGDVGGVYANMALSKSAVVRRLKRMVGSGLKIVDKTPSSRAQIMKLWKAERVIEAKECVRDYRARATARHLAAKNQEQKS